MVRPGRAGAAVLRSKSSGLRRRGSVAARGRSLGAGGGVGRRNRARAARRLGGITTEIIIGKRRWNFKGRKGRVDEEEVGGDKIDVNLIFQRRGMGSQRF